MHVDLKKLSKTQVLSKASTNVEFHAYDIMSTKILSTEVISIEMVNADSVRGHLHQDLGKCRCTLILKHFSIVQVLSISSKNVEFAEIISTETLSTKVISNEIVNANLP